MACFGLRTSRGSCPYAGPSPAATACLRCIWCWGAILRWRCRRSMSRGQQETTQLTEVQLCVCGQWAAAGEPRRRTTLAASRTGVRSRTTWACLGLMQERGRDESQITLTLCTSVTASIPVASARMCLSVAACGCVFLSPHVDVSFCRRMWMCLSVAAACGCVFLSQPHGDVSFCRIYMGMCLSVAATGGCVFLSQPAGARPARMYVCTSVQPWSRDPSGGKGTQLIGAVCAVGHLRALSPAYQSVTCVGPCPPHSAPMPAMTRVFLSSAFGKLPKAWQVLVDRIRRPPSYPAPKDNPQPPVCWACPLFGSRRPTARSTSKFGTSGSSRFQSSPSRVYRSRDCPFPPFPGPYPPCFRPARIFNATNTPRHHCHTQPTVSLTPLPVPQAASTLPATMPSHASPSPVPQAASTPPATIVLGGLGIVQCARIAGVASHCDY